MTSSNESQVTPESDASSASDLPPPAAAPLPSVAGAVGEEPTSPAKDEPETPALAHEEAAPGDTSDEEFEGPQGPELEGGDEKKKRRRRRKKTGPPVATAQGPEGPPVEKGVDKAGGGKAGGAKGPPGRERAQFPLGEEVFGKVTAVLDHAIMVDLAGKALAIFDRGELATDDLVPEVGDRFVAQVLGDGSRGGLVVITRKLLREEETKPRLEKAFEAKELVNGLVTGVVKGGLEVYVDGVRAFAPASHVDLRLGADLNHLIGQQLPFLVEQFAKRGRDVVVSRKSMLEEEMKKQRAESLAKLTEGAVMTGVVRNLVAWGAFVSLPDADNVEGLIHVSEVSHDPRARIAQLLKPGETVQVKVLRIDEKGKLWLSKKAMEADPWEEIRQKYAVGTRHKGTVVRVEAFGAFVSLEPGLDGLISLADLSIKRIEQPSDVIKEGQEVEVVVAHLDLANKRIALHPAPPEAEVGMKQRVAPHKAIKVAIVAAESRGLLVRILGASGRQARGFVPAGQTGTPRGTDLRKLFPVGSEHEVKVIEFDPRRGEAKLSVKALKEDSEKAAYNEYRASLAKEAKFGTFGDLLKRAKDT